MRYVCDAPAGKTWFRLETLGEAEAESEAMRHAVEKYYRREHEKAAQSFKPRSTVFIEQEIGLKDHIQREMPLFLTLRNEDGVGLATAMIPPAGRDERGFRSIIVGPGNSDPYAAHADALRALAEHFGITLDRAGATHTVNPKRSAMGHTLNGFAADCHRILAADPGPDGREKVRALLEDVLADGDFVATHLGDDVPERKVLYEDPALGFCILAHVNRDAKGSKPHDHGPSWAIYGQASGETIMTDWDCVERPSEGKPGRARHVRDYTLQPGMAYLYNEGVLHSPRRDGPTRLIRLEGTNMDRVKRQPYEAVG